MPIFPLRTLLEACSATFTPAPRTHLPHTTTAAYRHRLAHARTAIQAGSWRAGAAMAGSLCLAWNAASAAYMSLHSGGQKRFQGHRAHRKRASALFLPA